MSDKPLPQSEFILYQTEDGRTRIQCRFENETLWLTQAQIAELFQTTPQNVTLHLKAIFAEGELEEAATCKDYLQVRSEGSREVSRSLRHYRLQIFEWANGAPWLYSLPTWTLNKWIAMTASALATSIAACVM